VSKTDLSAEPKGDANQPSERLAAGLAFLTLACAGIFGWWLLLRPTLEVDPDALLALPMELGTWESREVPIDSAVESMLEADFHLQRVFQNRTGEMAWFYLGYYGTSRGGRPEHVPRVCYKANGWEVVERRVLDVDLERDLRVNEYLVERQGERRLVHFWYRSHRRTGIVAGLGLSIDHLIGRVTSARADGALVRLSTPIREDGLLVSRAILVRLATEIDPELDGRWPAETPITRG